MPSRTAPKKAGKRRAGKRRAGKKAPTKAVTKPGSKPKAVTLQAVVEKVYQRLKDDKPDGPLINIMINQIMKKLEPIAKTHRHEEADPVFTFRRIDEVAAVLQPLLVEFGVFIVPVEIKDHFPTQLRNQANVVLFNTRVRTHWRIYASDGSYIEAETMGEGMSDLQFSTGVAQTMAYKQLLWELFMIPVLGMDAEESSNDQTKAMSTPPAPESIPEPRDTAEDEAQPDLFSQAPADVTPTPTDTGVQTTGTKRKSRQTPAATAPSGEKMTKGMAGIVISLLDQSPGATLENLLAHFKVSHLTDLYKSQMKAVEDWIATQGAE